MYNRLGYVGMAATKPVSYPTMTSCSRSLASSLTAARAGPAQGQLVLIDSAAPVGASSRPAVLD